MKQTKCEALVVSKIGQKIHVFSRYLGSSVAIFCLAEPSICWDDVRYWNWKL